MAGDWIKMRADLHTHPKVVRIASALKADRLRVVGGLHAVWCLFDVHSEDGRLSGYTTEALDDLIGFQGFTAALASVGWVQVEADSLVVPRFDEHNGQSAKRRATETERKRNARNLSASEADKTRSREEKRREEKKETKTTAPASRFAEFWGLWPKSTRKGGKPECLKVWQSKGFDSKAELILTHVKAMSDTPNWRKEEGAFIPAPVVYLRGERWDGAEVESETTYAGAV